MASCPRWLEILFACLEIGAVLVPLNLTWTASEIRKGLALTGSKWLLVGSGHKGASLAERLAPVFAEVAGEMQEALPQVLQVEAHDAGQTSPFRLLEARGEPGGHGATEETSHARCAPDDAAFLILTSGSTSFPKPAIHTHETVLCGAASYADGLEVHCDDVFMHCMPNYHVGSLATAILTLMRGAALRLVTEFEPGRVLSLMQQDRATLFWGFDTHFLMMREHSGYSDGMLKTLQRTMVAASPGNFDKIKAMGLSHIGSLYGSTEYMGSQTYFPYRDRFDIDRMRLSNGRATSGEIRIARIGASGWAASSEIGEICVRGPALFKGYYGLPEESGACIDDEGFFHSGDIGYLDNDGYLYYRGRLKEMVKSGGENVSALEVENFLTETVPGVVCAMVCATPHPKWGEAVTALLQMKAGYSCTVEEVQGYCRGSLAGYKIPKRVLVIDAAEWPISPTGKVNRRALAERAKDLFAD
ncbi:acyl--CoA ligase [Alcaligenaceae bacterium]|nr:acyl--CoA ligase [Alcaligenaceae bacterium]